MVERRPCIQSARERHEGVLAAPQIPAVFLRRRRLGSSSSQEPAGEAGSRDWLSPQRQPEQRGALKSGSGLQRVGGRLPLEAGKAEKSLLRGQPSRG